MAGSTDDHTDETPALRRSERERAARYLDLWERNLSYNSIHGVAPCLPVRLTGRSAAAEE